VEHIIQDGASSDRTLEILERYRSQTDWVSQPDRCQADALDKAIRRSRGDILLVLNADDQLRSGMLSWAAQHMSRHPEAAVIYGDLYIIDSRGNIIGMSTGPSPYSFKRILCVQDVIPAQAAFIRRSHLAQVGLGRIPGWTPVRIMSCSCVLVPGFPCCTSRAS
jgi:glycosyltransferase involved in cell wall biosynthesis